VSEESFRRSNQAADTGRVIFITGTDTGAGKTLLTALLLHHLRGRGRLAMAMKPFCSGGTHDVDVLSRLQDGELSREEICPYPYAEPVAPLVAARKHRRQILLGDVVGRVRRIQRRCKILLIEGSGGLMVPLGEGFLVADLIASLQCHVLIAAPNRLGVINHALLTARTLDLYGVSKMKVALMGRRARDLSTRTNGAVLAELLAPVAVVGVPFLGKRADKAGAVKARCKKVEKILAQILDFDTFCPLFKRSGKRLSK